MIAEAIGGVFAGFTVDPIHPRDPALAKIFGFNRSTTSGVAVTEDKAIGFPPVWRGVNILCNGVAKPRLSVYRRLPNDERERATDHPAYRLLTRKPNSWMGASEFRRLLQFWALIWGNGCAYIRRNQAGEAIDLWPLLPDRTTMHAVGPDSQPVEGAWSDESRLIYVSRVAGETVTFQAEDVLHIHGLGYDGFSGYPVVELLAEAIGLGMAAQEYGSRFFGTGATASGLLMAPPGMKPEQMEDYGRAIRKGSQGLGKAHQLMILGSGAEFKQLSIPPEHAQFLQTREFEIGDISNVLGVQAHKIGDRSNKSYNSLEQSNQEHLDDDLDPLLGAWEEECGDKVLSEAEKESDTHYVEFNRDALIRTNLAAQTAEYSAGRQWGWYSQNDVRRKKNMPRVEGGDTYLSPANMVPTTMLGQLPPAQVVDDPDDDDQANHTAELIAHEESKLRTRVAKAAVVAARKGPREYGELLERIPSWAEQPVCISPQLQAVAAELCETFGAYAEPPYTAGNFAAAVVQESARLLETASAS